MAFKQCKPWRNISSEPKERTGYKKGKDTKDEMVLKKNKKKRKKEKKKDTPRPAKKNCRTKVKIARV